MDSENDSTDTTAGSPVLGSSTFKRKFLKTKCTGKSAKKRLSDKFDNELVISDLNQKNSNNVNATCKSSQKVHIQTKLNENDLPIGKFEFTFNVVSNMDKTAGFQTASGKPLFSNSESSDFANNLMGQILNPFIGTNRENKYNFLSKNSTEKKFESSSTKCLEEELSFSGFKAEEYRNTHKRNLSLQNVIKAISSETYSSTVNVQHSKHPAENYVLPSQIIHSPGRNIIEIESTNPIKLHCTNENIDAIMKSRRSCSIDNNLLGTSYDSGKIVRTKVKSMSNDSDSPKIQNELARKEKFVSKKNNFTDILYSSINEKTVGINEHSFNNDNISKTEESKFIDSFSVNIEKNNMNNSIANQQSMNIEIMEAATPQFSTASGKKINISSNKLLKIHSLFKDITDLKIPDNIANVSEISNHKGCGEKDFEENPNRNINRVHSVIDPLPLLSGKLDENLICSTSSLKICNKSKNPESSTDKKKLKYRERLFGPNHEENIESEVNCAQITERSTKKISSLFSTASGKNIKLPSSSLLGINKIFKDIPDFDNIKEDSLRSESIEISAVYPSKMNKTNGTPTEINNPTEYTYTPLKRALNSTNEEKSDKMSHMEEKMKQESNSKMNEKIDNTSHITPQRTIPRKRRLGGSSSKGGQISEAALNRAKSLFGDINLDDLKLPSHLKIGGSNVSESLYTPIKPNKINTPQFSSTPIRFIKKNTLFLNDIPQEINHPYLIQKPTSGNLNDLEEELNRQKNILEKKLEFVMKKQEAVRMQIHAQTSNKRLKFEPQEKRNKMNLKDIRNLEIQSDYTENTNGIILQVNPQNAALIHFNNNWSEISTVTTEDGCTLVPNAQGLIGISEIEPAFNSMPGIEKNLIPDGWIKNHYRWIIWKLASYERFFPVTLGGCFSIDNVIKQLKYRYSREIYNAERPALRKIYEKDDVPQKRMVLCISNIIKNGDDTELELTDGWYVIRTMVDNLLCHQINQRKIKIGSKLIISGAELLNCEGCHPLEVEKTSKVRLKIYFNCTRRAAWFSKLGYQKDPSPLSIKLNNAVWNGGTIGRITVYIMRVYPVIYREKTEASVLWRNRNAEYKKIQEFENECYKKYEECDNVNIVRRNVCPLLQMTVIDFSDTNLKPFKCTIWDSTDSHQEQLKENQIVTFYNLTLRCNGELSCNKKSYFQVLKYNGGKYEKYRRKCVGLASYQIMSNLAIFGEFDTAGFIVRMHIEQKTQHFWLTDLKNNFLLIKVVEGPNSCLLLNNIEENHLVAVCNLSLKGSTGAYVIATASFQTTVTQYPQYDFLREKIKELEKINENEILSILQRNRKMVDNFENGNESVRTSYSSGSEENTLNFSRITSTDAVMSMINIDEIVSKHKM